jgi:hypothetical protein
LNTDHTNNISESINSRLKKFLDRPNLPFDEGVQRLWDFAREEDLKVQHYANTAEANRRRQERKRKSAPATERALLFFLLFKRR